MDQKERGNEFNVRCDWREGDASWTVDDTDGTKIYTGIPEKIQTKMWRDMALKAIVKKDQSTLDAIMEHCYDPAPKRYQSNKPRFGEGLVDDLFAVQGERLVQYRINNEKSKTFIEELRKMHPNVSFSELEEDNENCNVQGYPIEDEWYADDAKMQEARAVLKK